MGVITQKVGVISEWKDGEMKEVKLGEKKVLVSRVEGKFYATSHMCTHYKAQLSKGTLTKDGRVMCPWHGACFDVKTGDIEDAPALDALAKFDVKLEGNDIIVTADETALAEGKRTPSLSQCNHEDKRVFVIVGGGAAGMLAAETLREEGYTGKILMISRENHLPIDRIKLSKALNVEVEKILLRNEAYFKQAQIDTILGVEVVSVQKEENSITLSNGSTVKYDSLLLCTGGDPRFFWPKSRHLKNIFMLRGVDDASKINKAVAEKEKPNIVVIGSSFIGMEAAAILVKLAGSLTVIGMEKVPFERVLGEKIGHVMQKLHESKDVKFKMGSVVKEFESNDGETCNCIILESGDRIDCDVVVVGAGVAPATDYLKSSFTLEKDGSIVVDKTLKVVGTDNIFAAGDIARYPYHLHSGGASDMVRIEHWNVAQQHGRVAAKNMIANTQNQSMQDFKIIPYFWTTVFGKSLRYTGHALKFDDVIIEGSLDEQAFIAYYALGDEIVAVASLGKDPAISLASEAMRLGLMPSASKIRSGESILNVNIGSDGTQASLSSGDLASSSSSLNNVTSSSSESITNKSSQLTPSDDRKISTKKPQQKVSLLFKIWPIIVGVVAFAAGYYLTKK